MHEPSHGGSQAPIMEEKNVGKEKKGEGQCRLKNSLTTFCAKLTFSILLSLSPPLPACYQPHTPPQPLFPFPLPAFCILTSPPPQTHSSLLFLEFICISIHTLIFYYYLLDTILKKNIRISRVLQVIKKIS